MSFIARQPNGLLCRHSSVVDCVTDYNMTEKEYIELHVQMAKEEAEHRAKIILVLARHRRGKGEFYPKQHVQKRI